MADVMKECCGMCPFSRKNTLYLHPDRVLDFACSTENPYNDFVCHKTGVIIEEHPIEGMEGSIVRGPKSLTCAGFHAMQSMVCDSDSEIEIDMEDHFSDKWEMVEHHEEGR